MRNATKRGLCAFSRIGNSGRKKAQRAAAATKPLTAETAEVRRDTQERQKQGGKGFRAEIIASREDFDGRLLQIRTSVFSFFCRERKAEISKLWLWIQS